MANNQLTQWVQDQKQKGFQKDTIITHLQNQNYNIEDINVAIQTNFPEQTNNTQPTQVNNIDQNNSKKINIKEMFKQPEHPTQIQEKESKQNLILLTITIILTIIISIYFFKFR
jgi:hypothetical protein